MFPSHQLVRAARAIVFGSLLLGPPLPILAQQAESAVSPSLVDEIIVTATRREESLIDVPVSVATITPLTLDAASVGVFQEMIEISPSLTYTPSGGMRGDGVLIRGIGTTAFQSGVEPTVSTVVDGVVLGRTGSFLTDLVDIERVELLRGPQGTLFGKNASGGVINVITARPSEDPEAFLSGSIEEDDAYTVQGMASGPIAEGLYGRLTAFSKARDGFIDNVFDGRELNDNDSWGLRGKLLWEASEDLDVLLIADYSSQQRDCCVVIPAEANGGTPSAFGPQYDAIVGGFINFDEENDEVAIGSALFSNQRQWGVSAEINWDVGDLTVTSISSYREWSISTAQDVDDLPFIGPTTITPFLLNLNGGVSESEQWSQELRIANNDDGPLTYVAGVFFWAQELDRFFERAIDVCFFPGCPPIGLPLVGTQYAFFNTTVETFNAAAFGNLDYALGEQWSVFVGGRFVYDELDYDFDRRCPTATPPFGPTSPPCTFAPAAPPFQNSDSFDDTDFTARGGVQWDFSELGMLYLSYARGYKSQAADIIFGFAAPTAANQPIAPETSDAFELGTKLQLWDGQVIVTAAAFHTEFEDFQAQTFNADPAVNSFVLESAGSVITRGVEVDVIARPIENLTVTAGFAYTDAFIDQFDEGQCWTNQTASLGCTVRVGPDGLPGTADDFSAQDLGGDEVPNSPDWKVTLQGRYDIPIEGPIDAFIQGNFRWQDDVVTALTQQPGLEIDSYGIVDLALGITSDDGHWTASVFVENLFDEFYPAYIIQTPLGPGPTVMPDNSVVQGNTSHFLARDHRRYFGFRLRYDFYP